MNFGLKLLIAMNKVYNTSSFSCFEKQSLADWFDHLPWPYAKNKIAYLIHQSMKNNIAFSFNANGGVPFPSNPIKPKKAICIWKCFRFEISFHLCRGDQVGGGGSLKPPPRTEKSGKTPPRVEAEAPPLSRRAKRGGLYFGFFRVFSGFLGYFRVFLGFLRSILGFYRVF